MEQGISSDHLESAETGVVAAVFICVAENRMGVQVDLNRDFPDPIERGKTGVVEASGSEQPETLALMRWIREGRFVVSASLHEVKGFPLPATGSERLAVSPGTTNHVMIRDTVLPFCRALPTLWCPDGFHCSSVMLNCLPCC